MGGAGEAGSGAGTSLEEGSSFSNDGTTSESADRVLVSIGSATSEALLTVVAAGLEVANTSVFSSTHNYNM